MATGAAGVRGHPAAEGKRQEVDSATTLYPAMEAGHAQNCSKSLLPAFKIKSPVKDAIKIYKRDVQCLVHLSCI